MRKISASGALVSYVLSMPLTLAHGPLRLCTCSPWAEYLLQTVLVHDTGYPCMDGRATLFHHGRIAYI